MSSTNPLSAHVGAAAVNQTVGDWRGNRERIQRVIREARGLGIRLLVLPEMCISGYSLGDRLPREDTLAQSWSSLELLAAQVEDMVVCVGLPISHRGVIYNSIAVLSQGRIQALVAKEHLATGDVEYENRWYQGWQRGVVESFESPSGQSIPLGSLLFKAEGLGCFALEICEDGWKGLRPGSVYALMGAEMVLNPSASWFVLGKHAVRRRMVEQISREDHVAYVYCSLQGCDSTRLIFDGSTFIAANGSILREGRRFVFREDHTLIHEVLDLEQLRQTRREEGSWRQQVRELELGHLGPLPETIRLPGVYPPADAPPAPRPYWIPQPPPGCDPSLEWLSEEDLIPQAASPRDLPHLELELALAMGLHQYVKKAGLAGLTLALSGGRDSAMVALLVHRMLHYSNPQLSAEEVRELARQRLVCAYMATENSGSATEHAARTLAEEIGATFHCLPIQPAVDTHLSLIQSTLGRELSWADPVDDIALQNVQARLRGSLIWMLANLHRFLLLSTSNKSEAAVGYTTMDGDTSGGLSPIADVPKSLVSLWLRWAQSFHGYESLQHINGLEPSAELRPRDQEQTDEEDLMPFVVLDQLLYQFVQCGRSPLGLFQILWPGLRERYEDRHWDFVDHIRKFVRLFCFAQWKRERFAISFRVTAFDLDPKTGCRFPPIQAPFTEELRELELWVGEQWGARPA